jgi:hypothetical protein
MVRRSFAIRPAIVVGGVWMNNFIGLSPGADPEQTSDVVPQ